MKLSYADVVKMNLNVNKKVQPCTKIYSREEMANIISECLEDAYEEIDEQNKIELDEPMIWTKGFSDENDDDIPIVEITNYEEQDNLPENVKFIATLRQLQEWNEEREKNLKDRKY